MLYNARVNSYHKLIELDALIDQQPTTELVKELAETRIENLQAFKELQSLNDTGDFKYKHPVIIHFNIRSELEAMLTSNPELFLEEYANTRENVKRYRSYLNNKKRSKEQRERDEKNLRKHAVKENLMKDILGDR